MKSVQGSRAALIPVLLAAVAATGVGAPERNGGPKTPHAIADPPWLREYLEEQRERHRVPALAASMVVDGEVVAASAVGFRRWGVPARVTRHDKFHLGSDVKPMTATLVAVLVEAGVLRWNTTVDEMFPGLRPTTRPAYRGVTVVQLLSHTSGMPYEPRTPESVTDGRARTVVGRRHEYVRAALQDPPEAPPGTKFIYGGGPILVASYLERRLQIPYERLMHENVFRPLGMTTAGFGPLATPPNKLDGPWEHVRANGRVKPIPPDPSQRSQARSAVGRNAHASIVDLGRFAALHLRGARGESDFLKAETFRRLHTPVPPSNYALGWGRDRAGWHKGLSLAHGGSNGQNQCLITIIPDENYAICVMTNIGGADASALCNRVTKDLARELKQRRPSRASDDGKG